MSEKVYTRRDGDIRYQKCRCAKCGFEAECTPACDFYGEDGEPLLCEGCMLASAGLTADSMITVGPTVGEA